MEATSSSDYQHLIDIFKYLDNESLQQLQLASKLTYDIVKEHFYQLSRPNLEIVQIHKADDKIQCRCLHKNGKARTFETHNIREAFRWLNPLIHNTNIRLFAMIQINLSDSCLHELAGCLPCHIKQLSMSGVDFLEISPSVFEDMLSLTLRADRYAFTCVTNVASGHFNGKLLESEAFMEAEQIDIDILSFQHLTLPCLSFYENSIITWFFHGRQEIRRTLIGNRLCLGPFFLAVLLKTFMEETTSRPAQMVLCGRITQCTESYKHLMHLKRGKTVLTVRNERTAEELIISMLASEDKVEVCRSELSNNNHVKRLRPVGQAVR
ncbi:unnamed protein product [Bursaphelenchus xylophilus]|uniref:(pine wood nematode) hypothetical protein n=1 Tax=Bursaphelenchus xylophilus TaxID=6326 RepID=A0A1I7RWA2_BURXY|nr:unnamed protein product [Bursaphelenchus xylophilus]CAG9095352.1 unnamed protein product [Bursaphelenchus xylophilus]